MKFLIIEDSKADTEILTRYIQKSFPTASVHACNNFNRGITCLVHEEYDYILLELNLPDNFGISTMRELKPYSRKTPVFVITGMAHDITIEEAIKAGASKVKEKRAMSSELIGEMVNEEMALVG